MARGQQAKPVAVPAQLGVDEKAVAKGQRYLTVVCDLTWGTVEYLAADRQQASLDGYFTGLTDAQRDATGNYAGSPPHGWPMWGGRVTGWGRVTRPVPSNC